ncbi:hypothetical protein Tco_0485625 [Tanacetum coccineum]
MVSKFCVMQVGLNMNRVESWNAIVEKFKEKLSFWKAKTLSFGGRLTLVRSVLGSLSLYYFSMFRAPASVIQKLERERKNLFWGGGGDCRKLAWVKWEKVEGNSLWVRVIKSIYGDDWVVNSRGTWSSIIKVGKEIDRLGIEFTSSFGRKLGNGERFLGSYWVELVLGLVANTRGRSLGELEDCISLVRDQVPTRDGTDSWQWMLEDGGFIVKVLKEMVDEKVLGSRSQVEGMKWCKIIPRKVNVFFVKA